MKPLHKIPLETSPDDELGYQLFREVFWNSGEICNSCFSRVRSIGPEIKRQLETSDDGFRRLKHGMPLTITINEYYERTDDGSQEHTTWDNNKRFGTCFCLNCGTDCNGHHRNKSLEELKPLAKNIFFYTKRHTPHDIDHKRFGREIKELKSKRSAQGHETEVIALAFGRALEPDIPSGDATADAGADADSRRAAAVAD